MAAYTPEWLVKINGSIVTDVTLANLVVTSGRTDIYSQPVAGYCQVQLINLDNSSYPFNVGTGMTIEVTDSSGDYVPIFGGYISDFTISVNDAGSVAVTTVATITALGALSKLPKIIDPGVLSVDEDGDQIYTLLSGYLLGQWNEVPAAQTWATYNPTETWENAVNLGLGDIDRPGSYSMIARSSEETDLYSLTTAIANSALGVLYEDAQGNIGYADSVHRQNYLAANGYTILDANQALGAGLASTTKSGDLRNKYNLNYGTSGASSYTAQDTLSQTTYGIYAETYTSRIKDTPDAEDLADRYIALRAFPIAKFESITFPLGNPEIDSADRDALLNIFMGQPVWIQNLPGNISDGSFQGYIEGWRFQASYNDLRITFNASPIAFSQVAVKWYQVNAAEAWNTLSPTLIWNDAIGAVA
jgi:hypothetical protein